ncbi:MAG: class I SAM-dependent methyltransferase [Chloroflexi bacterium]|nr:class I SAM-dependent methyltransferase [Chloroflexota bacterium]
MTKEPVLTPPKDRAALVPAYLRRRAEVYARHPLVRRPRLRFRFAGFAGVRAGQRVLDVATGPGYNAFAFARRAAAVTGVDAAPELLEIARRQAARRRLANVAFSEADPASLPFPDGSFDLVTASGAVHHFASPAQVFSEMARVCAPGGTVAIEDVVASEQDVRARYHNRLERLRDRSHRRFLPLSELLALLGWQALLVRRVQVQDSIREFNEWVGVTRPPVRRAEHIRRLLQGAVEHDLSGLNIQPADDTFFFVQEVAWVLAVKAE